MRRLRWTTWRTWHFDSADRRLTYVYLIYAGVVTAGGNSALLSLRESLLEDVLALELVHRQLREVHAMRKTIPSRERKLFNRVSCSGRPHLSFSLSLPLFPRSNLVTGFLFLSFRSHNSFTQNRQRRGNLDRERKLQRIEWIDLWIERDFCLSNLFKEFKPERRKKRSTNLNLYEFLEELKFIKII